MLIDQSGERQAMLKIGEQKSIQTDRVVLVRGPDEEVKIVRWIYQTFIDDGKNESEICQVVECSRRWSQILDARGTRATVHQVLTNEKYMATMSTIAPHSN